MEVFRLQIEPLCMQYSLCTKVRIKSQYLELLLHIITNLEPSKAIKPILFALKILQILTNM